jgi:peptidoglycan/LPS O-acetylase OafA/YrhL
MAITAPAISPTQSSTKPQHSLRVTTVGAGLVAAAATAGVAAALHATGVSFDVDGEIPLFAFAQMTFIGAVIGGLLVAVLNRRSATPHRTFVRTSVVLVALSCVPSVLLAPEIATKLALVATHLVAAAIIVPVLARHTTTNGRSA